MAGSAALVNGTSRPKGAATTPPVPLGSAPLRRKVVPPGLPVSTVARPRLDALFASILAEHEALVAFATAGSGKTVQAQLFADRERWPLAWLTLDKDDCSPSRMLSYLGAALKPFVGHVEKIVERSYAGALSFDEVAAALAEAIEKPRLLVVFDQCEAIAKSSESCSALESFLEYLPRGARAMLLSRDEIQCSLGRLLLHGRAARVTGRDLALTLDEATSLLQARGGDPTEARTRWEAAGGWVAAVAFGVRQPGGRDPDDFRSYLEWEIFDRLPPEERRFLLDTSVLDAVSLYAASTLCGSGTRDMWRKICNQHLPATVSADREIVYHPCFRDFLREQLELESPERKVELQRRFAALLVESSQFEEAVQVLLSIASLDDAAKAAEAACPQLIERGDYRTFLRWVDALGSERVQRSPILLGALIRSLQSASRLDETRALVRELDEAGQLDRVVAADNSVLTHIAWSMLWQPSEGLALLDRYHGDPSAAGARFMLEVTSGPDAVLPPEGLPGPNANRLVSWALMVQGRLEELMSMLPPDDEWPPRTPYTTPHPLLGLIWRGDLTLARDLFDHVSEDVKQRTHVDLWGIIEAWLLLAEGDPASSLIAAQRASAHSRQIGFGFEPIFQVVEAQALLRMRRVEDAIRVLEASIAASAASGLIAYVEWGNAILGNALLVNDENESAVELLRAAVAGMQRAHRLLLLPMAAVCLAEAESRLGNVDDADAATVIAHEAACQMGAFPALEVALDQFPRVLHRQRDRHPHAKEWRRVGNHPPPSVTTVRRPPSEGHAIVVEVRPFGPEPDILVDGSPTGLRRLKSLELACLLSHRPEGVPRDQVHALLFPEADRPRGSNYFRQAVHQLRKATGLKLQRLPDGGISWSEDLEVDASDRMFERALGTARAVGGAARLERLQSALALVTGPYLAASELEWVSDRRYELAVLQEDAEVEVAELAFETRELDLAARYAKSVIARDPYCEPAYRVLMQVELATGNESGALATYRRAISALREIGLEPSGDTASLLHHLELLRERQ